MSARPPTPSTVVQRFSQHYGERGYTRHQPVGILSRVDPSVRFVGSTISVLKPLLLTGSIPDPGVFLTQQALRTRNLDKLLVAGAVLTSPSSFVHSGVLAPPSHLARAALDAWTFLNQFTDGDQQVIVRVHVEDPDIAATIHALAPAAVVTDTGDVEPYRHTFGMAGITGRNLNFCIRSTAGSESRFGNLIVIEDTRGTAAIETAIGVNHLVAGLRGWDSPLRATPAAAVLPLDNDADVRLADALMAVVALTDAGLAPSARGRGRTFRRYLQALVLLGAQCGHSMSTLESAAHALSTDPDPGASALRVRGHLQRFAGSRLGRSVDHV